MSLVSSGASNIGSSVVGLWCIGPPTRLGGLERSCASSEVPPRARPILGKASSSTRGGQPQARTASSEVGLEQIDVRSERRGDRAVRSPRATRPVPIQINIEPCISTATTAQEATSLEVRLVIDMSSRRSAITSITARYNTVHCSISSPPCCSTLHRECSTPSTDRCAKRRSTSRAIVIKRESIAIATRN